MMHTENNATLTVVRDSASVVEANAAMSMDGQGDLVRRLSCTPLAVEQKAAIPKRGYDHAFLGRYSGTDLVQWFARGSSGQFYSFGALMRIGGSDEQT